MLNAANIPATLGIRVTVGYQNEMYRIHDRQLHHLVTNTVELADRPKTPTERRSHGIARVLYTWLRREREDVDAMVADILSLEKLGRSEKWKRVIRVWAEIAWKDPDMFFQHATYANFEA